MQRPTKALGIDIPATLLGPRRRGDRLILPFAAVHGSVAGTKLPIQDVHYPVANG
jgi:hypothetical protein